MHVLSFHHQIRSIPYFFKREVFSFEPWQDSVFLIQNGAAETLHDYYIRPSSIDNSFLIAQKSKLINWTEFYKSVRFYFYAQIGDITNSHLISLEIKDEKGKRDLKKLIKEISRLKKSPNLEKVKTKLLTHEMINKKIIFVHSEDSLRQRI